MGWAARANANGLKFTGEDPWENVKWKKGRRSQAKTTFTFRKKGRARLSNGARRRFVESA